MTGMYDHLADVNEPFGKLYTSVQIDLFAAWLNGYTIEYKPSVNNSSWSVTKHPTWCLSSIYRVQPRQLIPDSINWYHVHSEYNWMARDRNGDVFLYKIKPELFKSQWLSISNDIKQETKPDVYSFHSAKGFSSLVIGTVDWKDSLVQRPGT